MPLKKPLKGKRLKKEKKWSDYKVCTIYTVFSNAPFKNPASNKELTFGLSTEIITEEGVVQVMATVFQNIHKLIGAKR